MTLDENQMTKELTSKGITMSAELELLAEILKRNVEDPNSIDIKNEINHYFFFDVIANKSDLETAWSVFDEHREIRNRLSKIEMDTAKIPGFGYRIPQRVNALCSDDELKKLVASHISSLRPILIEESYNEEVISFIDRGFSIEIAPPGAEMPSVENNELFGVLYEAISEYWIEHFPWNKPHYEVLKNWAIYLTKCDEVAAYLMWPCLKQEVPLDPLTMEAGAKLWKLGCRDRYWIKDLDFASKAIYINPLREEKDCM